MLQVLDARAHWLDGVGWTHAPMEKGLAPTGKLALRPWLAKRQSDPLSTISTIAVKTGVTVSKGGYGGGNGGGGEAE